MIVLFFFCGWMVSLGSAVKWKNICTLFKGNSKNNNSKGDNNDNDNNKA